MYLFTQINLYIKDCGLIYHADRMLYDQMNYMYCEVPIICEIYICRIWWFIQVSNKKLLYIYSSPGRKAM
jgi:hypothetical protein